MAPANNRGFFRTIDRIHFLQYDAYVITPMGIAKLSFPLIAP
jgi:hypothetical protein